MCGFMVNSSEQAGPLFRDPTGLSPIKLPIGCVLAVIAIIFFTISYTEIPVSLVSAFCAKGNALKELLLFSFFGDIAMLLGLLPLYFWGAPAINEQKLQTEISGRAEFLLKSIIKDILLTILLCYVVQWIWTLFLGTCISFIYGVSFDTYFPEQKILQIFRENIPNNEYLLDPFFFSISILAPITEELLFRYFLYRSAKKYLSRGVACLLVAFLFACCHSNVRSFAGLMVMGIALTRLYEKYKNLWVPILTHSLFNTLSTGMILLGIFLEKHGANF